MSQIANASIRIKQSGRYLTDTLLCENLECASHQEPVSEEQASYLFSQQPFWQILLWKGSIYICPFCGGSALIPFNGDFRRA